MFLNTGSGGIDMNNIQSSSEVTEIFLKDNNHLAQIRATDFETQYKIYLKYLQIILNCFKDYKRCSHILNRILDLA